MFEDWSTTEQCINYTWNHNQTAISLCPIWHRNNISSLSRQFERQQHSSTMPNVCC